MRAWKAAFNLAAKREAAYRRAASELAAQKAARQARNASTAAKKEERLDSAQKYIKGSMNGRYAKEVHMDSLKDGDKTTGRRGGGAIGAVMEVEATVRSGVGLFVFLAWSPLTHPTTYI